jgi:Sulfotransferase family
MASLQHAAPRPAASLHRPVDAAALAEALSAATERPVFLFASHRTAGAELMRLLNCHPDLVIWGEHAGFINHLAEAAASIAHHANDLPERSSAELERFVTFDGAALAEFSPWMNAFESGEFNAECRQLIRRLFARGLRPRQRWGFQESRYHSKLVARFLITLFPGARFVTLRQDPVETCVANILATATSPQHDMVEVFRLVETELRGILAVHRDLEVIGREWPVHTICVQCEAMRQQPLSEMRRVFGFLTLEMTGLARAKLRTVELASGAAPPIANHAGDTADLLKPEFIRHTAQTLLPRVSEAISKETP